MASISPTLSRHTRSGLKPEGRQSGGPAKAKGGPVIAVCFVLGLFGVLQFLVPLQTAIQIGADEGFELAKTQLCLEGFRLYEEAWNDQPPMHTALASECAEHLSPGIGAIRLITLAFAGFLLISVFSLGMLVNGRIGGIAAAGLLIASPGFLELSASCMLEIPALAPAVAGLAVLARSGRRLFLSIGGAGLFFGIAVSTKLIALILLPVAGLILLLKGVKSGGGSAPKGTVWGPAVKRALLQTGILGVTASFGFILVNLVVDCGAFLRHFHQSWSSHFAQAQSFEYGSARDYPFEWSILLKNWDLTIPGVIGTFMALRNWRMNAFLLLPVAWLFLMLAIFSIHQPWWSYYYIHIAIPLCWCAAVGIVGVWSWLRQMRSAWAYVGLGAVALCILGWNVARVYFQISDVRNGPQTYSSLVLQEIERFKPFTKFIYADEPIYSFHAGIPMPPQLAVVPLKRLWSGEMTNARIVAEMRATRPELVMLKNDGRERPFGDLILYEYQMVYEDEFHRLYAHRSIVKLARY